jgi:hypothetical protein
LEEFKVHWCCNIKDWWWESLHRWELLPAWQLPGPIHGQRSAPPREEVPRLQTAVFLMLQAWMWLLTFVVCCHHNGPIWLSVSRKPCSSLVYGHHCCYVKATVNNCLRVWVNSFFLSLM